MHAPRPGPLPSLARAGSDQLTLELGQAAEHSQHEPPMWGGRIRPSVIERPKAGLIVGNSREGVEQVARGAGQPIQAGDKDDITGAKGAQKEGQLGAVGAGPADLLTKDLLGSSGFQLSDLRIKGLTVG